MHDQQVIDKLRTGDDDILGEVYKAHRSEFFSWVISHYKCDTEEAKDHYQFAILKFYENVMNDKLSVLSSSIKTYLFAIGKNKVLESHKKAGKFVNGIDDIPIDDSRSEAVDKEKKLQTIEKCLSELGEPCSSLLKQYYYHRKSMDDIADLFNYSNRDTAKNLKFKCMQRLRKLVKEEYLKVA